MSSTLALLNAELDRLRTALAAERERTQFLLKCFGFILDEGGVSNVSSGPALAMVDIARAAIRTGAPSLSPLPRPDFVSLAELENERAIIRASAPSPEDAL